MVDNNVFFLCTRVNLVTSPLRSGSNCDEERQRMQNNIMDLLWNQVWAMAETWMVPDICIYVYCIYWVFMGFTHVLFKFSSSWFISAAAVFSAHPFFICWGVLHTFPSQIKIKSNKEKYITEHSDEHFFVVLDYNFYSQSPQLNCVHLNHIHKLLSHKKLTAPALKEKNSTNTLESLLEYPLATLHLLGTMISLWRRAQSSTSPWPTSSYTAPTAHPFTVSPWRAWPGRPASTSTSSPSPCPAAAHRLESAAASVAGDPRSQIRVSLI